MRRSVFGLALGVFAFVASSQPRAQNANTQGDGIGTAQFTTDQSVSNFSATARTVPYWRSAFTDPTNGVTYPSTMVGTDPAAGDASTVVPTVIIPFRFEFVASADPNIHALDATDHVVDTVASPMFQT